MATIQDVIRSINRELVPQFEERLRQCLLQQDKEWLIDQIIRLSLDAHSLEEMDRMVIRAAKARKRAQRAARVREMALDLDKLIAFLDRYRPYDRERLRQEGFLTNNPPACGTEMIPPSCRSEKGEAHRHTRGLRAWGLRAGRLRAWRLRVGARHLPIPCRHVGRLGSCQRVLQPTPIWQMPRPYPASSSCRGSARLFGSPGPPCAFVPRGVIIAPCG